jgi:diadenosine tetraphosphate (Ap4A) HIT family hydrolase
MDSCVACDLATGRRPRPGGLIHRSRFWLVEHCIGSLGVGTLIVKPERHVTSVGDLTEAEALELGPLLRRATQVVGELVPAEQIYNCLWSNAGGVPVHIHYVVQPITAEQMTLFGSHGPRLQVAMFTRGDAPNADDVQRFADSARTCFARSDP